MKINYTILKAILWTAAIFASGLLHGPQILILSLNVLAFWAITAGDKRGEETGRPGQERVSTLTR
ncbi:MAG: hypothetical protein ACR2NX_13080 [Chthoniobacterales bacterium]